MPPGRRAQGAEETLQFGICTGGSGLRRVHRECLERLFFSPSVSLLFSKRKLSAALKKEEWLVAFA